MPEIWRNRLALCKQRFEKIAAEPGSIMACLVDRQPGHDVPLPSQWLHCGRAFRRYDELYLNRERSVNLRSSDDRLLNQFAVIAKDAGLWINSASPLIAQDLVAPESLAASLEVNRWLFVLFDLCWSLPPGIVQPAQRMVHAAKAIHNSEGGYDYLQEYEFELDKLPSYRSEPGLPDWAKQMIDSPTGFYSIIENVASESASVLDWLLRTVAPSPGNDQAKPTASAQVETPEDLAPEAPTHTDDFSSVNWYGTTHNFNKSQAMAIQVLWEAWEKGKLSVRQETIGAKLGSSNSNYRLLYTFRSSDTVMHEAWGTMIQPVKDVPGSFVLAGPESQKDHESRHRTRTPAGRQFQHGKRKSGKPS